jgi:CheY-like chemotaxis protein
VSVSILVVDDEPDVAELFENSFVARPARAGYLALRPVRGEGTRDRLAGEIEPMLVAVLSDVNMPGMDGCQLLVEIKQRFPHLPVMMVTAYGDDERPRQAVEFDATEFVTKPVDFDYPKAQLRQLPSALD